MEIKAWDMACKRIFKHNKQGVGEGCNPRTFLMGPLIGVLETLSFGEKGFILGLECERKKKNKQCV
jgi:hypothetical protein